MLLILLEAIKRSGGDDLQYFQSAYYWKYQRHIDVWGDVLAFRTQQVIPKYVEEFTRSKFNGA